MEAWTPRSCSWEIDPELARTRILARSPWTVNSESMVHPARLERATCGFEVLSAIS